MAYKRFLVTGASGFVGTHMVKLLVDRGYDVTACDLEGTDGGKYEPLGVKFAPVDITHKPTLYGVMDGIDVVMHVAAIFDYTTPWNTLRRVNVKGTRNVCEAAAEQNVNKLVYFSSCDIYGDPATIPANEKCKIQPNHNYGESKFLGEREAFKVGVTRGLPVTVLRPTALYGPGGTYGAILLVNMLYHRILPGIPGGGNNRVHLVHVKDVVNAALFLAEHPETAGQEYNLADDTPVELRRLLRHAARAFRVPMPRIPIPRFAAEASIPLVELIAKISNTIPMYNRDMLNIFYGDRAFNASKIKTLGYKLLYPDFFEGFEEVLEWYKESKVLKRNISAVRVRLQQVFE